MGAGLELGLRVRVTGARGGPGEKATSEDPDTNARVRVKVGWVQG